MKILNKFLKKNCDDSFDLITIDSIYCINLKRSNNRRKLIEKEAAKISKKINIFNAIDGNIVSVKKAK